MELILMIILLLAAILAFLYLCKKMGINVNELLTALFSGHDSKPNYQLNSPIPQASLIIYYNNEYEDVSSMVLDDLKSLRRTAINCPSSPAGIHCENEADKVRIINGQVSFFYEVPVTNSTFLNNGKITTENVDVEKIRSAIAQNLPFHMKNGYGYSGEIHVTDIGHNHIRIEVCGVYRC